MNVTMTSKTKRRQPIETLYAVTAYNDFSFACRQVRNLVMWGGCIRAEGNSVHCARSFFYPTGGKHDK